MKTSRVKALFLTIGLLSISQSTVQAMSLKKISFVLTLAGIIRLAVKRQPNENRLDFNQVFEKLHQLTSSKMLTLINNIEKELKKLQEAVGTPIPTEELLIFVENVETALEKLQERINKPIPKKMFVLLGDIKEALDKLRKHINAPVSEKEETLSLFNIVRESLRKLKVHINKSTTSEMFSLLWHTLDDIIIGYQGKVRGLMPYGRKIVVEGEAVVESTIRSQMSGEIIELRRYPNIPPYGLLGTLWAYIKPIGSELKSLNDILSLKDSAFAKILAE